MHAKKNHAHFATEGNEANAIASEASRSNFAALVARDVEELRKRVTF